MVLESWANVAKRWVSWGDVARRKRGGGWDMVCWARVGLSRLTLASVKAEN